MTRRKRLIGIVLILFLVIGFGCIIIFNWKLKKSNPSTTSNHPTINPTKEQEETDKSEESHYELEDTIIRMEYPNGISYPGVNQFNVLISFYPLDALYCKISADIGKTSKSKIDLEKEKMITYYLPDNFNDYMLDVISFKFYDEYSQFIKDYKIYIRYDENTKRVQILEMNVE